MKITTNYAKNDIQFNGLSNRLVKRHVISNRIQTIANILGKNETDIIQTTKTTSSKNMGFLSLLTDCYNKNNFYKPIEQKDSVDSVLQIYRSIKKPNKTHYSLITSFNGSMQTLNKIFQALKNEPKRANFAYLVNKDIVNNNPNTYENLIPELLESENSQEYISNYDKYISYLILHGKDSNVVKNLDKMINDKTFNPTHYDNMLRKKRIIRAFPFENNQIFNSEIYYNNYTEERGKIILKLYNKMRFSNVQQNDEISHLIKEIYDSTNAQNYDLRAGLVHLRSSMNFAEEMSEMNKLFNLIDRDECAKKFMQKFVDRNIPIDNIKYINDMLDNIPSLKLNIFSDNAFRIMDMVDSSKYLDILKKELENPFYETHSARYRRIEDEKCGYKKRQSSVSKFIRRMTNRFKVLKYRILEHSQDNPLKESAVNTKSVTEIKPQITSSDIEKNLNKQVQTFSDSTPTREAISKTDAATLTNEPKIEPKIEQKNHEAKISAKISKDELKANIFEILNLKLGKSTFAKQKEAYGKNATKIKLSMLPEIFASVADTRKADRAVGKHRINSSNKDVLDLYLLINGSNKKYINYLLKKRNVDGTRMFEIKDIISMIKKAETKIAENKKSNPNYRARDARQYYNHLYESKIQQYGKVTRPRKNKIHANA